MTIKEFILSRFQLFFFLVTLILVASCIVGTLVAPEEELHYYHFLGPIITAALCVLPTCVTYFRKEPTVRQYILRLVIQLVLIEGVVMTIITPPADSDKISFYFLLGSVTLVIYILASLMMWSRKYQQSKKFTQQLKQLQSHQ